MVVANDCGPFQEIVNVHWNTGGYFVAAEWTSTFQSDGSTPLREPSFSGKFLQFPHIGPSIEHNFLGGADFASLAFADEIQADKCCPGSYSNEDTGTAPAHVHSNDHYTFRIDWSNPPPPGGRFGTNSSGGGTIDVSSDNGGASFWEVSGGFLSGSGDVDDAGTAIRANITSQGGTVTLYEILTGPVHTDTTYTGGTFFTDTDNGVVLFNFARMIADGPSADDSIVCHIDTGEGAVPVDNIPTFYNWTVKISLYASGVFASFPVDGFARPNHWPATPIATVNLSGTGADGNTHFDIAIRPTADGTTVKQLEILNVSTTP